MCREGLCPFSGLWVLVDKNLLLGGLRQKPDAVEFRQKPDAG